MELSTAKNSFKRKLYLLYSLNAADWICTAALLRSGWFYEVNPLARSFIGNTSAGFAIKCIVPAVLITLIVRSIDLLDSNDLRRIDMFTSFALVFYTLLCIDHIINFAILFLV